MALRKHATLQVLESWRVPAQAGPDGITKFAHRVAFSYDPRPGYLYVRSRMISSRTNDNHDTFPAAEIEKGYKTFLGKPVFVNHHNANHRRARGVIVAVALHRDRNPDGTPDTWVEGLMEVDAARFPRLAKAILAGKVNRTSMGVDVEWSHCSACGNKATSPAEYCSHLPAMKGKKIRKRNPSTGKVEEKLIHEICAGLSFFENSLLVEEPADPTAYFVGDVDARGLNKAASKNAAGDEYASGYGNDPRFEDVSLRKDSDGFYVATHRARSKSYPSPEQIPDSKIEFIRSTGSASPGHKSFDQLQPHEQRAVDLYHQQMVEEGSAQPGSTLRDYLYEVRQEPRAEFLKRYMNADDEFRSEYGPGDWEAHHQDTIARHPVPRYPAENRWPLIVSDANPNYVDDGYHRMHSYIRDGATHLPTVRMHRQAAAGDGEPDFRDHIGNSCIECGQPVHYARGLANKGRYPWKHHSARLTDHDAWPSDPDDRSPGQNMTYSGGHCAVCHEPVKINLAALDINGGWHHRDGLKRDHPATPADPWAAYNSIPGQKAQREQARQEMGDYMHRRFEEMNGGPLPRRPRGDEDQMPPDPFTASRRRAAAEPGWLSGKTDRCINCGRPFGNDTTGDWRNYKMPMLCNDCAYGHTEENSFGKPPAIDIADKGGMGSRENTDRWMSDRDKYAVDRRWSPDDAVMFSESAKKQEGGDHPFFHANPVSKQNIIDAYNDTTDDEKALGHRWYADAHHVAKAIAGGDAALGAGLLSSYSVRTSWPVNMFNASRAYQGDPPGPGSGAMSVHQKPAMAMLGGKHWRDVLRGPKTRAFAHLIEHGGDTDEDEKSGKHKVVIDRHAMSVAMGRRISDKDDAPIDKPQHYEHVAQLYRDAAADISKATGKKVSPHQVQASTWLRQIRKNNEADAAKTGTGGAAGKGRAKREENARGRWQEHHREHHQLPEENMHYHGSWEERPDYCTECGNPMMAPDDLHPGEDQFRPRSSQIPHLCVGCADPRDTPYQRFSGPELTPAVLRSTRPWRDSDSLPLSQSSRKLAYGETRVPPQVDTLRMEECPVCGEREVWSGERCPVCGFIVPPSLFRDPDVNKAMQIRQQLDDQGEVVTDPGQQGDPSTAQIGSGQDADEQLMHPDQIAPDGVPAVQGEGGPVPAADTDGQPRAEEEGELPPDGEEEEAEGEAEAQQGEQDEQLGQQEMAEGQQLEEQGEEDQLGQQDELAGLPEPDLECPACGAHYSSDVSAQPGTPCPACRQGSLQPVGAPEGTEDPDEAEDPEEAEAEEEDEGEKMAGSSKTAAALAQAQARRIAELTAQNEVLHAQLSFLASAAGVDRELAEIGRQVMRRHADVLNPASPVPDPPEAPPTMTTEEALMSGGKNPAGQGGTWPRGTGHAVDDPSRPGSVPGGNANVPAQQTTTAITPGVEMQTPPATQLIDVTAPVQGTNPSQDGGVPIQQRRIETDVRIDPDPLKAHGPGIGGMGDNGAAFPWLMDGGQPQQGGQQPQQKQMQQAASLHEADGARRTFASIRLAKMRVQAGLAQGEELAVAERIEKDASLPTVMIEHEIATLEQVGRAGRVLEGQQPRPMQRAAARQAPSLASVGAAQYYAPAVADDGDASDLFF